MPIHTNPEIMGGVPVFVGTRVPAQTLFDYLADGCSLDEFLDNFPTVDRGQVLELLQFAERSSLLAASSG